MNIQKTNQFNTYKKNSTSFNGNFRPFKTVSTTKNNKFSVNLTNDFNELFMPIKSGIKVASGWINSSDTYRLITSDKLGILQKLSMLMKNERI